MKRKIQSAALLFTHLSIFLVAVFAAIPALASMEAQFLYSLSDFNGVVPFSGGKVTIDNERSETYVIYGEVVRVFNDNGMEVYSFSTIDTDADIGIFNALAVLPEGDMITLSYNVKQEKSEIIRRNYRGEPISQIEVTGLPAGSSFSPSGMVYRGGLLYFADGDNLQVVVTDLNGLFQKRYDLFTLLELKPKDLGSTLLSGFDVDKNGDILFTVAVLFRAYVLSPDEKLREFGEAGSLPGKFNIAGGITSDDRGNYIVTDRLKGAVQVFDRGLQFQYIFGDWDGRPGTLRVPTDVATDQRDKVFVVNSASRGVSVFRLLYE
jgi:hypothetical protein